MSVSIDECAHRSDLAFGGVEDSMRRVGILEIVFMHRGAHAEPFEFADECLGFAGIAAPGHRCVVRAPECGDDVPSVACERTCDAAIAILRLAPVTIAVLLVLRFAFTLTIEHGERSTLFPATLPSKGRGWGLG
jgi:hypothetical protein